ncbi:HlyD family efflux transporter periplasmic adaptor subunit [Aquimarina sp. U1-2]|uniref:HlyD family secretion protein n=1 Tax=Aquimarina sp. U1-2 TaxID=2823141 RepID=UPI001AECB371|nr:HlyD family efflux transporter periplasmic adaptor subunit [Aquimarina sp. U1-2]MBP2832394.1 HlyD family efflux transporter periplasmic adaptor subunit [Aquimarina sp. U1-2]
MEENQIFPEDILRSTVEYHVATHSKKTNILFWIIFMTIAGIFTALPFIYVDLYTTSRGIIVTKEKKVSLYGPSSGRISQFYIEENKKVKAGDTLLVIDHNILQEKGKLYTLQIDEQSNYIQDLKKLLKKQYTALTTDYYKKEYLKFKQDLFNIDLLLKNAQTEYDRSEHLYKKEIISKSEYEKALLELGKIKNDRINIIKQTELSWQKQLTDYNQTLDNLNSTKSQLHEEQNFYVLRAPISGELINVQGYNEGSVIAPGNLIAEISPDTNFVVETYVTPADIGYLREGENAKYQIDSYNSHQWGFANGTITEIGSDIILSNDMPVYVIKSSLDDKSLFLRNGSEGKLKKGMTLTSRFFLTKRSMMQLLFDEIEDWFNPYNHKNEENRDKTA